MSAPHTNVEKQAKRHRPALWGIAFAAVFGVAMIMFLLFWSVDEGETPSNDTPQTELGVGTDLETGETTPAPAEDGLAPDTVTE
ncbi:hypothetical protein [Wenxinia saemankumensis]|uniref:Uncharacterized protein n=1 Tax=Wenxinia saemankumensis TaxID=1447782 RepID=A0A1M6CJT8_9RHOB|nr:hypothetical protein [Wenxinia saemankumensis]SHI61267.1 hypothetical protein SAMN05444417_1227 [Wenxinia saemankumensis]